MLTKWTSEEDRALVQFVGIHSDLNPSESDWPAMCVDSSYWLKAAQYVNKTCQTPHLRSGMVHFNQKVNTTCRSNKKSINYQ